MSICDLLANYAQEHNVSTKGNLAVVLYVTRKAKELGLPLDASALRAKSKAQIAGLSKTSVQAILADYGIVQMLAKEAGRTSRGSIRVMEEYVNFLNSVNRIAPIDLCPIEAWWVNRIKEYFASKPFLLRKDAGITLNVMVRDVLDQAIERQHENPGTMYAGAVLQHMVGAKLQVLYGEANVEHHGFSVADDQTGRAGDFFIGNTVIHVTTMPSEALIEKCITNIHSGYRAFIVTLFGKVTAAKQLAEIKGIHNQVEVIDAEQFIATNLYEWSGFDSSRQKESITELFEVYNELIDKYETDPSLKISVS